MGFVAFIAPLRSPDPVLYPHIRRPDEAIPAALNHELHTMGRGFVMCITGGVDSKTGAGKSLTAINIASEIDKDFDPKEQVVFSIPQLVYLVNKWRKEKMRGKVVILDEAAITLSSRAWFTIFNKVARHILLTFRHMRCVCILVTPTLHMIDSDIRKLITFWGSTIMYNTVKEGRCVDLTFHRITTDKLGKRIYYTNLRFYAPETGTVIIGLRYRVYLVKKQVAEAYEVIGSDFKEKEGTALFNEARAYEEANAAVFGRGSMYDYQGTIAKMLTNPDVTTELREKGRISSTSLGALYPTLGNGRAVKIAKMLTLEHNKQVQNGKQSEA